MVDFSDLRAVYLNCTLTRSPGMSHTQRLMDRSIAIMEHHGVQVTSIRAVDHHIAPGVYPDMTQHGAKHDDWPGMAMPRLDGGIHRGSGWATHRPSGQSEVDSPRSRQTMSTSPVRWCGSGASRVVTVLSGHHRS